MMATRRLHWYRNRQVLLAAAAPLLLCIALWGTVAVADETAVASAPVLSEKQLQKNRVKAAVVLNIARFVEWPAELARTRNNHLTMCYFREDVLGEAYDVIRDRRVNGRDLQLEFIDSAEDLGRCDLLLLSERVLQEAVPQPLVSRKTPLLVIKDLTRLKTSDRVTGQPYPGVHVALVRRGSKIGFEINLSAANDAGLKISSRLLRLAHIVGDGA